MNDIHLSILNMMSENEYISAKDVAEKCNCSDKTIRTRIKEINNDIKGAQIVSKPRYGYHLVITDNELFDKSKQDTYFIKNLPSHSKERVDFLMRLLLSSNQYYKLEDISQMLYVSSKTLSSDLHKLEKMISQYDLKIERKPNYGIRVIGSEFNFRLCLSSLMFKDENNKEVADKLNFISNAIKEVFDQYDFKMSDIAIQNLINHIYISMERINKGHIIVPRGISLRKINIDISEEYQMAKQLCCTIEERMKFSFPDCETEYIAIHLAGKKMFQSDEGNFVVTQEVTDLVNEIIIKVKERFHLDLSGNLDLILGLSKHLVPMLFRLELYMNMRNPLLNQIKENYLYAYTISEYACSIIEKNYHRKVSDDEIGYIALHFALALEQARAMIPKKNILVVCASGLGTSQFLLYKYREEFGKYINHIEACGERELERLDLDQFDYIFSTVPVLTKVSKPIIEVNYFLSKTDIQSISRVLMSGQKSIQRYYSKQLFMELESDNRFEIIHQMCQIISQYEDVPVYFEKSVLEREEITSTEFGNQVALTHPLEPISKRTFAAVAVLKEPIIWKNKEIKVVFLISIEKTKNKKIEDFYKITSTFLVTKKYMDQFLKNSTFDNLMMILLNIESECGDIDE